MRFIDRNSPPPELGQWKQRESMDDQRHYDGSLPTEVKDAIRKHRVADQGYLCAYTMRRIQAVEVAGQRDFDAHIEHVTTRNSSRIRDALGETVDYRNLVACVNRKANLMYGASVRGDTMENLPVSPFRKHCDQRFRFHLDGSISGVDDDANQTIKILRLSHPTLNALRQSRIAGCGLGILRVTTPGIRRLIKPLVSAKSARRLAKEILEWGVDGSLPEFCIAISQAAYAHAERIEKEAQRLGFIRCGVRK